MDCSPPGSSVHGILQARILEWDAISSSRGSSQPRDRTRSCLAGGFFTTESPEKIKINCISIKINMVCGLVCKSCPTLLIPWTVVRQAPLSMGFSKQQYRSGLPPCFQIYCCSPIAELCPTLFDPLDSGTPGFPVLSNPGVCPDSCPFSQWCHQIISSSVTHFSSCFQINKLKVNHLVTNARILHCVSVIRKHWVLKDSSSKTITEKDSLPL